MMTTDPDARMEPAQARGIALQAWRHVKAVVAGLNLSKAQTRQTVTRMVELAYSAGWTQGYEDGTRDAITATREVADELGVGK